LVLAKRFCWKKFLLLVKLPANLFFLEKIARCVVRSQSSNQVEDVFRILEEVHNNNLPNWRLEVVCLLEEKYTKDISFEKLQYSYQYFDMDQEKCIDTKNAFNLLKHDIIKCNSLQILLDIKNVLNY